MSELVSISHTDLKVGRINLGGNVFGWTLDEKESFQILDAFVEAGFNFLDTADTYPWWKMDERERKSRPDCGCNKGWFPN